MDLILYTGEQTFEPTNVEKNVRNATGEGPASGVTPPVPPPQPSRPTDPDAIAAANRQPNVVISGKSSDSLNPSERGMTFDGTFKLVSSPLVGITEPFNCCSQSFWIKYVPRPSAGDLYTYSQIWEVRGPVVALGQGQLNLAWPSETEGYVTGWLADNDDGNESVGISYLPDHTGGLTADVLYHVLITQRTYGPSGDPINGREAAIYINGVLVTNQKFFHSDAFVTAWNGLALEIASGAGIYDAGSWSYDTRLMAQLSDVWIAPGVDLSVGAPAVVPEETLRKFINEDGTPADPAGWPTAAVMLYGNGDEMLTNHGTGGPFTKQPLGPITTAEAQATRKRRPQYRVFRSQGPVTTTPGSS